MSEASIFIQALELAPEEREAFLREACGEDAALRVGVAALLREHEEKAGPLDESLEGIGGTIQMSKAEREAAASHSRSQASPEEQEPPSVSSVVKPDGKRVLYFGDYELQGEIARGAMGVVYRAEQKSLKRTVAIKMIRSTLLANEGDVARFLAEAEAAASLDHPNIVPIYEVGEHEEQHYFSMKLIEGGTLRDHIESLKKNPKVAAKLMVTVAGAIHAAHQRGILHRDLKPGNILIDENGDPHVTDFGLAKQMESNTSVTLSGQIMGTPQYMAPEQAEGGSKDLTTAADVYALGAILYELLCGKPPHQGESLMDTLRLVAEVEPELPRRVYPKVNRDLETIAMKCLEKDPAKRYASAQGLKNDLERWLRGEPIVARPVGAVEKVIKWMKRKPMHAAAAALAAMFLLTLGIGGPIAALRQAKLREEAEGSRVIALREREAARQSSARANLALAEASLREGNGPAMRVALSDVPEDLRDSTWSYLHDQSDTSIAQVRIGKSQIFGVAADPTRPGVFAVADSENRVTLVEARTGVQLLQFFPKFAGARRGSGRLLLAFSPDGERIAVGLQKKEGGGISIHNARDGTLQRRWKAPSTRRLEFDSGGQSLIQLFNGGMNVWRADSGRLRWEYEATTTPDSVCAVFTPDGRQVLTYNREDGLRLVNAQDGTLVRSLGSKDRPFSALAVHPDGGSIVAGLESGVMHGLSLENGRVLFRFQMAEKQIDHLLFTPEGTRFISAARISAGSHVLQVRDAKTGALLRNLLGSRGLALATALHPLSGEFLVSGEVGRVWVPVGAPPAWTIPANPRVRHAAFWGSDDWILAPYRDRGGFLLDLEAGSPSVLWQPPVGVRTLLSVSAEGRFAAVHAGGTNPIQLLRNPGRSVEQIATFVPARFSQKLSLSPTGDRLAVMEGRIAGFNEDRERLSIELFSTAVGAPSVMLERQNMKLCRDIGWLGDGQWLVGLVTTEGEASPSDSQEWIYLWNAATAKVIAKLPHPTAMRVLAVAPDGSRFAEAGVDKKVRIRDARTLAVLQEFRAHNKIITAMVWHPAKPILATGSAAPSIKLWDLDSGRLLEELRGPVTAPTSLAFSPSGRRLACTANDEPTRIWEPPSLRNETADKAEDGDQLEP